MDKLLKRRANILYRLRKKGFRCDTKGRTIFIEYGKITEAPSQVWRLRGEFGFEVQFEIR